MCYICIPKKQPRRQLHIGKRVFSFQLVFLAIMGVFRFQRFEVDDSRCGMKIGTDGVLIGAWATPLQGVIPKMIMDVGAGSGVVSLMLAQRFPQASITAVEIDPQACMDCRDNFLKSPFTNPFEVINQDFLNLDPSEYGDFDMIVSNPPFFNNGERSPGENRSLARHQDSLPIESLIKKSAELLSPTGTLSLVLPANLWDDVLWFSVQNRLNPLGRCKVITKVGAQPKRMLVVFTKKDCPFYETELLMHSSLYNALVGDFYLKK